MRPGGTTNRTLNGERTFLTFLPRTKFFTGPAHPPTRPSPSYKLLKRKREENFMNELSIILGNQEAIDFAPSSQVQEIIQNVRTILTTYKYSVPLDREFGLNATMLDEAQPRAMALLSAEIAECLALYEPRVKLREVSYTGNQDGKLCPVVKVRLML